MYKIIITKSEKMLSQIDNVDVLDVSFNIIKDDEVVAERRVNFPLATSAETIESELLKILSAYERDQEIAEQTAANEAASKVADETIEALQDKQITKS